MTAKGTKMISSDIEMCIVSISVRSQTFHLPVKWKWPDWVYWKQTVFCCSSLLRKHSKTIPRLFHQPLLLTLRNGVFCWFSFFIRMPFSKGTPNLLVNEFIFVLVPPIRLYSPQGTEISFTFLFQSTVLNTLFPFLYLFKVRSRSRHLFSTSYSVWCFSDYTVWDQEWGGCEQFTEYLKNRLHFSCLLLQPSSWKSLHFQLKDQKPLALEMFENMDYFGT